MEIKEDRLSEIDQWFKNELARIRYDLDFSDRKVEYSSGIHVPERSNWRLVLFNEISYYPVKGFEPNLFQRKIMEWCLGVKWVKNECK